MSFALAGPEGRGRRRSSTRAASPRLIRASGTIWPDSNPRAVLTCFDPPHGNLGVPVAPLASSSARVDRRGRRASAASSTRSSFPLKSITRPAENSLEGSVPPERRGTQVRAPPSTQAEGTGPFPTRPRCSADPGRTQSAMISVGTSFSSTVAINSRRSLCERPGSATNHDLDPVPQRLRPGSGQLGQDAPGPSGSHSDVVGGAILANGPVTNIVKNH